MPRTHPTNQQITQITVTKSHCTPSGNVRGRDPASAYAKMRERLQQELGDAYELFLLSDKVGSA